MLVMHFQRRQRCRGLSSSFIRTNFVPISNSEFPSSLNLQIPLICGQYLVEKRVKKGQGLAIEDVLEAGYTRQTGLDRTSAFSASSLKARQASNGQPLPIIQLRLTCARAEKIAISIGACRSARTAGKGRQTRTRSSAGHKNHRPGWSEEIGPIDHSQASDIQPSVLD